VDAIEPDWTEVMDLLPDRHALAVDDHSRPGFSLVLGVEFREQLEIDVPPAIGPSMGEAELLELAEPLYVTLRNRDLRALLLL
jgi:hypothetical protein